MNFFPPHRMKTKKRLTAIWHYIRPELVGFIRANVHFFVWSSSVEISIGGRGGIEVLRVMRNKNPNLIFPPKANLNLEKPKLKTRSHKISWT